MSILDENEVRKIVAEILELEVDEIPDEANFIEDLDMDSLRALEILASLEKNFKISIPQEELKEMKNMKSVIRITKEYYDGKLEK
jgi:acyl carrier protein